MKNLKLATKMLLLSVILMASVLAVAYVALGRLSLVNSQIAQLVDSTNAKAAQTADVNVKFLASVRAQKNSVLAPDDESSKLYAANSKANFSEARDALTKLKELVDTSHVKGQPEAVEAVDKSLAEYEKINTAVLDLAAQNTNIKAKQVVFSDLAAQVKTLEAKFQVWLEATDANSEGLDQTPRWKALYAMNRALAGLEINAIMHNETSVPDEMTAQEKVLADLQETILQNITSTGAATADQIAVRSALSDIKATLAKVTTLSRLDTNNRSIAMSLAECKVATDDCALKLAVIDKLLADEAKTGRDTSQGVYSSAVWWIWGVTLGGILIGAVIAYLVTLSVTSPVSEVRNLAQAMANGDLRQRLVLKQQDEIGELSDATNSLAEALNRIVTQIQSVSEGLAGSATDLTGVSNQLLSQSETATLKASSVASASEQLSANISTMAAAAEEMSVNVASISSASEEMSVNVGMIASTAEQTSTNVGVVSNAVGEISSSFADVLNDVRDGSRIASEASNMADSATATIQTLSQSGTEISKVTEAIKMIALQTNLLALNATIEATSAGEAGKGFAVVAHEIKELANQSAKAAEDIARKIEGVQNDTRQAVNVIQNVSQIIKDINASSNRISQSVEKQTRAAAMISQNVGEANKGVGEIARSISEVAKAAGDMSRNVAEAARGATDVSRNVNEAAKAAGGISSDIHQVSSASQSTNQSATKVHDSAEQLDRIGKELKKLVGRFKINKESIEG